MVLYNFEVTFTKRPIFSIFLVNIFTVILCVVPVIVLGVKQEEKELSPREIEDKLKDEYIIPDVIYAVPKHKMKVRFELEDKIFDVNYGTFLTPKQAKDQPIVEWPVEKGAVYTLLCVCPDVPDREEPMLRDWVHWLNVNIQGNNVSTGNNVNHWNGPGPTEISGLHRYVFLVFKQNPNFDIHLNRSDSSDQMRMWTKRLEFNTDAFVHQFNLGDPWASNFFMSRFNNFQ